MGLEWHLLIPGDICWHDFILLEYTLFFHFQVFYFFQLKGIHIMIIVHVTYLNKTVTCYSIRNVRIWITGSTYTVFTMLQFDLKIEKSCKKVVESEWILVVFSSTKDDANMINEIWSEIVGENIWNRVGTLWCNQV